MVSNVPESMSLVDPELRDFLAIFPSFTLTSETLPAARALLAEAFGGDNGASQASRAPHQVHIPSEGGRSPVRTLIYQPATDGGLKGGILHVHGGGFVMGSPEGNAQANEELANRFDCVVLSPAYRLAPEHRYPAAVEDLWTVLQWFHEHAAELGVDPRRIVIKGESAGGGLAAALALWARDHGALPIAGLLLSYPMLDDRCGTVQPPVPTTGEFAWTPQMNSFCWESILGQAPGSDDVPIYASPARAKNLAGLPPTTILTGALDLFLGENLDFARSLIGCGVPTNLQVFAGGYHAFDVVPDAKMAQRFRRAAAEALQDMLA